LIGKQESKKKKQEPTKERKASEGKKAERWRVWFGLVCVPFIPRWRITVAGALFGRNLDINWIEEGLEEGT
jgi:hypothetical protein